MSDSFDIRDLTDGDVLLYRAEDGIGNLVSMMIRKLDGTEVSHAGLCTGGGMVAEALGFSEQRGLISQTAVDSVEGADWVAVCRREPVPGPMTPVIAVAETYLRQDNRYGYEQILLLAGICLTRKLDWDNWLLRRIARKVFDFSTALLEQFRTEGKEPMICSEFVFRTYDEALPEPDDPYSLEILSQTSEAPRRWFSPFRLESGLVGESRPEIPTLHAESLLGQLQAKGITPTELPAVASGMAEVAPPAEEELDALIEEYLAEGGDVEESERVELSMDALLDSAGRLTAELAEAYASKAENERRLYGLPKAVAPAAPQTLADVVADFVTPGDLLKSPSLKEVGRIRP